MKEIYIPLQMLGCAAKKVGAEVHVIKLGVLLVVSEERGRLLLRTPSDNHVARLFHDAADAVAWVVNWRPI